MTKPDFRKKMFGPKFGEKGAKKAKNEVEVVIVQRKNCLGSAGSVSGLGAPTEVCFLTFS